MAKSSVWRSNLSAWASTKVGAWWFPWFLASINFVDYFCFIGFVSPVLQGVAFANVRASRAALICCMCAIGGFLGSWCLMLTVIYFDMSSKFIDADKLADASDLLGRWGIIAGLINGVSPLPSVPFVVAAATIESNHMRVVVMLAFMSFGRFLKYVGLFVAIVTGQTAVSAGVAHEPPVVSPGQPFPTGSEVTSPVVSDVTARMSRRYLKT
eukprot:TRINITY_DN54523_c0_g1_i1.p1 TRINITY_DN54523_c0_g1~~TRINITY_DN54523_c0_g1_i1.p1  ORF type:complete len:227 (-),score=32.72 TRINITY_DN54523_c0_g1_i1:152-784(-)